MEPDSTSSNRWQWSLSEHSISMSAPSPVVSRSTRSSVLQRRTTIGPPSSDRINTSLRTLDNVLTGSPSVAPTATPITFQTRGSSFIGGAGLRETTTPSHRQSPSVTTLRMMNESGLFKDMTVQSTPSHSILFSPDKEEESFHLSRASSPPLKLAEPTYENHPMLQVGLELMVSFHHHLQERPNPSQVLNLLEGMEQTCSFQIEHLKTLENSMHIKDVLIELQLERDTWQLVRGLYSDRLAEEEEEEEEEMAARELISRTDKVVIDDFYTTDKWVRQGQIVVDWLEQIANYQFGDLTSKMNFFVDSGYWESTLHDIKHCLNKGSIVSEMDPDAPSRQGKHLSDLDEKDEVTLCKNLFNCVRSGDIDKAQDMCVQCGQPWRAATLEGWKLYHDPNLDRDKDEMLEEIQGNLGRTLWKFSCWEMSSSATYNDYEKAVYASLSGNINALLPVCHTWYDYVWAYFKVMIDVLVEQKLLSSKRYPVDHSLKVNLPDNYWKAVLVPEVIFQEIEACPLQKIRRQCVDSYHLAQKCIILGALDLLIEEMHSWLQGDTNLHLLRFMAHLTLFVQRVGLSYDEEKCYNILETFIKILVSHGLNDLVALYCSYLSRDRQVTSFCHLLANINDPLEQKKCLEMAKECSLDVASITKGIVQGTLMEHQVEVPLVTSDFDIFTVHDPGVNEVDQRKIDVMDWLFHEETHRIEALHQCNILMREFLALNKYGAAGQVYQKIPFDSIAVINREWIAENGSVPLSREIERDLHEYVCFEAYLKAIESFNVWFQHYHQSKPTTPTGVSRKDVFMEKISIERQMEKHKSEVSHWEFQLKNLVLDVKHHIYNVLMFVNGGWMKEITAANDSDVEEGEEDSVRVEQMKRLRQLCLPKLCFLLHSVFQSSNNFKECLQLADVVAAENHCLYKEFSKEELQHFLKLIHSSSMEATDVGLDNFGYSLT